MKIAIDISAAVKPRPTGMAISIKNLVRALAEVDRENYYYLCVRLTKLKNFRHFPRIDRPNFTRKIICEPIDILFQRRIDIFHSGGTRLPDYKNVKMIMSIRNMRLFKDEGFAKEDYKNWKTQRYRDSAQRATRIFTNSQACKDDILQVLKVPEEKIDVVYNGIGECYYQRAHEEIKAVREKFSLKRNYFLYVGGLSKSKNAFGVIRAFREASGNIDGHVELALAGHVADIGGFQKIRDELGLGDRVRLLGYVPGEELSCLYCGSRALLYPSFNEGFPNPVAEAMACGTPVITSSLGAMAEVTGDAGLLVDPFNVEEMAQAMCRLMKEENLRDTVIQRGLERAKLFSWERAARQMLEIYHKVYARN